MNARHGVEIVAVLWLVVAGVFTAALATDWTRVWHALGIPAMSGAGPWTYFGHLATACLAFVCLFLLVTLCRVPLVAAHARA